MSLDGASRTLAAMDFGAPTPIVIAIVAIVVGLLLIRFVIGSVITLFKVGILVAIGLGVYLGGVWLMNQF